MTDFSFVQITDHHLLESEEALRDGFCPGHAMRSVMRHISQHVVNNKEFPVGELVAAHILQVPSAQKEKSWQECATHEVISLLRDACPSLMSVLGTLSDVRI